MADKSSGTAKTPAAKKPARRKKASGPTPAAALKKLGITREDLDLLKELKAVRAANEKTPEVESPPVRTNDLQYAPEEQPPTRVRLPDPEPEDVRAETEAIRAGQIAQDDAKIAAVEALHAANQPIPEQLAADVRAIRNARTQGQNTEVREGPWFARNLRHTPVGFKLSRHTGKERLSFEPRGQRGDIRKLKPEDLEDDALITQVEYQLVEIITKAEAEAAISKQATNARQNVNPLLAMLRNERGEEYAEGAARTEAEFNSQGITVARLEPGDGGEYGNIPSGGAGNRGIDWQAARGQAPLPSDVQRPRSIGGNPAIISDGFAPQANVNITDNLVAAQQDAIARLKNVDGPVAGGITSVTVGDVERT